MSVSALDHIHFIESLKKLQSANIKVFFRRKYQPRLRLYWFVGRAERKRSDHREIDSGGSKCKIIVGNRYLNFILLQFRLNKSGGAREIFFRLTKP